MFRNEADLRGFASKVFDQFAVDERHVTTLAGQRRCDSEYSHHQYDGAEAPPAANIRDDSSSKRYLSPNAYYFAYLVVFGIAPSADEVELMSMRASRSLSSPLPPAAVGGLGASPPPSNFKRHGDGNSGTSGSKAIVDGSDESSSRVEAAMARIRRGTEEALDKASRFRYGRGGGLISRDAFLARMSEKYVLINGPFRLQFTSASSSLSGGGVAGSSSELGGGATQQNLWVLFDAIARDHKGYFTLADVETAVRHYRARMTAGDGDPPSVLTAEGSSDATQGLLPPLTHSERVYLHSIFSLCDSDNDGRVTFDQFKAIYATR